MAQTRQEVRIDLRSELIQFALDRGEYGDDEEASKKESANTPH